MLPIHFYLQHLIQVTILLKEWAVQMLYKSQTISSGYLKCKHHETHPCTQTDTFLLNELSGQIFRYKNITKKSA